MLFNRHKLLLALLESLGGNVGATDFQKHLFLFTRLYESRRSFEFLPYRFGCYSFQAAADKRKLIAQGQLLDDTDWQIAESKLSYMTALSTADRARISTYASQNGQLSGKRLIRHVYTNYPYFAIRSEIAEKHLSEEEYAKVLAARPKKRRRPAFFTIGYEGRSIEAYVNRLIENDVRLLVDVRKNPISRKYGFSKSALSGFCKNFGIAYAHLPDLGIPGSLRRSLSDPKDYDCLFDHYDKKILPRNCEWIQHLIQLYAEYKRLALTCFEREHTQCHRDRVAKAVIARSQADITFEHL